MWRSERFKTRQNISSHLNVVQEDLGSGLLEDRKKKHRFVDHSLSFNAIIISKFITRRGLGCQLGDTDNSTVVTVNVLSTVRGEGINLWML